MIHWIRGASTQTLTKSTLVKCPASIPAWRSATEASYKSGNISCGAESLGRATLSCIDEVRNDSVVDASRFKSPIVSIDYRGWWEKDRTIPWRKHIYMQFLIAWLSWHENEKENREGTNPVHCAPTWTQGYTIQSGDQSRPGRQDLKYVKRRENLQRTNINPVFASYNNFLGARVKEYHNNGDECIKVCLAI